MAAPVAAPAATAAAPGRIDFARQVEPIFRAACVECHGPDKVKARLRMDSVAGLQAGGKNGALFVPGDPDASLLMRRVLGLDGEDQMPLDNDPLTPEQLDTLRQWIAQGARYDARAATDSQPQP
jgi:mono/diheme cytochrome c family protein